MEDTNEILKGYENTKYVHYTNSSSLPNTVPYAELGKNAMNGVLKASYHMDGQLIQTYTGQENHVGVIAATRLGKTTSYVIPTIVSFAKQPMKRSMVISDPKGEIYRLTSETLRAEGYRVILLNFRDYVHSECWNPLTPIFRKYRKAVEIYDEVGVVDTPDGARNIFRGVIYDNQPELDEAIDLAKSMMLEETGNDIDTLAQLFMPTISQKDPYWENSARELLKAFIWAMLEDSDREDNPITEDTFSFSTILTLLNNIHASKGVSFEDDGYFTDREKTSRAYQIAKNTVIENGDITSACIIAVFNTGISMFRDCAMRLVTSCNSFEMSEIIEGPVAIYIDYRDEVKVHYQLISLFIQDTYRYLIDHATNSPTGKLDTPFYFVLDEFANMPPIKDFETTISACAGRNIWFILIIQSYAQLNSVYGTAVAEIIKDNLNVHIFFGSNNHATLEAFSRECGKQTRISPLSALNGRGADIETYQIETIPLIPESTLSHFLPGECIITEANSGYVMFSKLERYYLCDEFKNLKLASEKEYKCSVNPFNKRYTYSFTKKKKFNPFDF
ncbi:MAG: type IV secretory system conjugative DNA transfer family protein [Clostridia bacterium]|nr:type IV secretory system conjugative DNA transfer family protein [Clostridia bacterium]